MIESKMKRCSVMALVGTESANPNEHTQQIATMLDNRCMSSLRLGQGCMHS